MPQYSKLSAHAQFSCMALIMNEGQGHSNWDYTAELQNVYNQTITDIYHHVKFERHWSLNVQKHANGCLVSLVWFNFV